MNAAGGQFAGRHVAPLETASLGDTADLLNELHASVRLTILRDARRFNARVASFSVGASRYTLVSYGTEVELECEYDRPSESAILCLRGSCTIELDGKQCALQPGEGIIGRPRAGLRAQFSRDCERLVVRTRRPDLRSRRHPVEELQYGKIEMQAFTDLVRAASRSPALLSCVSGGSLMARPFGELISRLLQGARRPKGERSVQAPVPGPVIRAEREMRERAAEHLTVAELAAAAGVSERALQSHFQRYRNCTPMQALRDARLDMARENLLDSSAASSVSTVALQCGFNHLSRFAAEYRRRFGEHPSTTLARAAVV